MAAMPEKGRSASEIARSRAFDPPAVRLSRGRSGASIRSQVHDCRIGGFRGRNAGGFARARHRESR